MVGVDFNLKELDVHSETKRLIYYVAKGRAHTYVQVDFNPILKSKECRGTGKGVGQDGRSAATQPSVHADLRTYGWNGVLFQLDIPMKWRLPQHG